MAIIKKDSKKVDVNCRHSTALTGHDRHRQRVAMSLFRRLAASHVQLLADGELLAACKTKKFIRMVIREYFSASTVEAQIYIRFEGERLSIDNIDAGRIGTDYRIFFGLSGVSENIPEEIFRSLEISNFTPDRARKYRNHNHSIEDD